MVNVFLSYDPAIKLLGIEEKWKQMATLRYIQIFKIASNWTKHNVHKLLTGKQNLLYLYNKILCSNTIKLTTNIRSHVDESQKHHANGQKPGTKRQYIAWFHLYKISRMGKFIGTECRLGRNYLMGNGVLFWSEENAELDTGGDCTATELYTLKWLFYVMWISHQ